MTATRITIHGRGSTIVLPCGLVVESRPHDTASYRQTARDLGYGDDVLQLCQDHDALHAIIASVLGIPESFSLREAVGALSDADKWLALLEEEIVLKAQKLMRSAGGELTLIGQLFGKWTVLAEAPGNRGRRWLCRCACGAEKIVSQANLRGGHSKSCGCTWGSPTHGHARNGKLTPEYSSWRAMRARCLNPNHAGYADYGGRGITICERWLNSFPSFLEDMGQRPGLKYSLERNDPNGPYNKDNCVWAERRVQARNTRANRRLEINGVSASTAEWGERVGLKPSTIIGRLNRGWSPEDCIRTDIGVNGAPRAVLRKRVRP